MAEGFHSAEDEQALEAVLALAASEDAVAKTKDGAVEPAFANYLSQLVRFATGEDRLWEEPKTLLHRAIETWRATEKRPASGPLINLRLTEQDDWRSSRLILDIATVDQPFIVDSVSGALTDAGKPVSFFVNAIVDTARDKSGKRTLTGDPIRESLIHAEMDPPVDTAEIATLEEELRLALADVAVAVEDWEPMRARLGSCIAQLERTRPHGVDREDLRETIEFLKWLWDNRFALLGARRYLYSAKDGAPHFTHEEGSDLGIARDPEKRILKTTYTEDGDIAPAVLDFMRSSEAILIAKANARSRVHRRVPMDYVGVKLYGVDGSVIGEDRFIGLFTADAYHQPASDIPLLRAKVNRTLEGAGFSPGGHNEKALLNILETFPRDEMFQSDIESLRENSLGILRLYKRPRTKLFLRRDRFDRFISALAFVPRDRFSSTVREEIGAVLCKAFDGKISSFNPHFGDAALVRVHYIIAISPGAPEGPGLTELTRQLRTITRSWSDNLLEEMRSSYHGATPAGLFSRFETAFGAGYQEATTAREALEDIRMIEGMGEKARAERVYRNPGDAPYALNVKLYCRGGPLSLSALIPKLENMGLSVVHEAGYDVRPGTDGGAEVVWIHNFYTEQKGRIEIDVDAIRQPLEAGLCAVLDGTTEDDGFNALIVSPGLTWREAWALRAAAKYALQTGFSASQDYISDTLIGNPALALEIVKYWHARFNPAGPEDLDVRRAEAETIEERIAGLLDGVASLDQDRILRRLAGFFRAVTRTNFYQRGANGAWKPCVAFKIDSAQLSDIPEPKPYREIFTSGPRVDGVHLRFGPIARGGLRWSDRKEDFRTEVLGLVKAQRVKNAIIVPTGSKGGFYPKLLPQNGDRTAIFEEGRGAYVEFIQSLLDVTDNISAGKTVPPPDVVRWDEDDPYLVVAADKGTATFSDTANAIADEYGFWLSDAFASGGSAGYDHKAMGITARGAWEAVKRHFREMGKDIQSEPFTVAGVGDMSGDVFGNGMLLSKQIRLVAAFDHRDIFIDPAPDPQVSWDERKRLFDLPRSSWRDYDASLISNGGGVYSRSQKSITLTEEARALLGVKNKSATPTEVIRAILKLDVELFWLGGIGTYFKAADEDNASVGDRTNDGLRIDAADMKMSVIGEGANLGLTQKARIAFAMNGGRVNTDAIDNSAGVDSSDHEVNIKILLSLAIENGELKATERNPLLEEMTEDVARHVLRHNYDQTRALSLMRASAADEIDAYGRLMSLLEETGRLDRALEHLPDEKQIDAMKQRGEGLVRPELSVLIAYAKLHFLDEIVNSDAPDDAALENELFGYFPKQLKKFNHSIVKHRLRREIISTRLANEVIDTCGATFPMRVAEATGADYAAVGLAYQASRNILNLAQYAHAVDALDNRIEADVQISLYAAASALLREFVFRLLSDASARQVLAKKGVKGLVSLYRPAVGVLSRNLSAVLSSSSSDEHAAKVAGWIDAGAPEDIANAAATMPYLEFAVDIVNLAKAVKWEIPAIAQLFFQLGDAYGIAAVRDIARRTRFEDRFDRLALRQLTEDLSMNQSELAKNVATFAGPPPEDAAAAYVADAIDAWGASHAAALENLDRFTKEFTSTKNLTIAKLSLFARHIGELAQSAVKPKR